MEYSKVNAEGNYPALAAVDATIARTLIRRRKASGMTQLDLAREAGIRPETLNRAERGVVLPSVRTLEKIEKVLKKRGEEK